MMLARLAAGVGAALLWAYARACRERNQTQRRLARANLLRTVSARPGRKDSSRGDRTITIDITPDTPKLDSLRAGWSSPDDELPPALQGVPPEEIASWAGHFGHQLTPYEQQLAARSFELRRHLTKALTDAGGEWWREDSADHYPGRGGW